MKPEEIIEKYSRSSLNSYLKNTEISVISSKNALAAVDMAREEEREKAIKAFQEMCKSMCDLGPFCEMQKDCDKCSKFNDILNKLP
jgi:hypothetical protein